MIWTGDGSETFGYPGLALSADFRVADRIRRLSICLRVLRLRARFIGVSWHRGQALCGGSRGWIFLARPATRSRARATETERKAVSYQSIPIEKHRAKTSFRCGNQKVCSLLLFSSICPPVYGEESRPRGPSNPDGASGESESKCSQLVSVRLPEERT